MKLFIATKNNNKISEFRRLFSDLGLQFVSENDFETRMPEIEENGLTFEENALIKARAGMRFSGMPTIADDSGLCVDYLNGKPGIYSARFAGGHGDSKANNLKLLSELEGVDIKDRTAHFVCSIACVFPNGREFTVTGECKGYIDYLESGDNGFGYDPLFISSLGKFSEITQEEKNSISHRGNAMRLFKAEILKYL